MPEILGANIHEKISHLPWLNRERAYVQIVSKLLGVEFDVIWKRHKRQLMRKVTAWSLGCVAMLCAIQSIWRSNQPFVVEIRLNEASVHNDNLPPLKDAVVTIYLENETKCDTLRALDGCLAFHNIPHKFLNKVVDITVTCRDFINVDTTVPLVPGMTIDIRRDPKVYGDVFFNLWDWHTEKFIANTPVQVDGIECVSDSSGRVVLFIPMEQQKTSYKVIAPFPLVVDILTMPCCESFAIVKE